MNKLVKKKSAMLYERKLDVSDHGDNKLRSDLEESAGDTALHC